MPSVFGATLVDDLPFMMQRQLHHIPDERFAGQAAGTSSMDNTGYPISPDLVWNTLRMQCEGLFAIRDVRPRVRCALAFSELHCVTIYIPLHQEDQSLKPMSQANKNSQICVPSSRGGSPNRRHTACDSRTRRMVVPGVKQRRRHIVPRLRLGPVLSVRMRTDSCIGLWNACELWKPKWHHHCGGTRKALK